MILTFLNHKGGVAKTTSCANLGDALHRLGRRVLLVDTDQQCNLTAMLGFAQSEGDPTLAQWMAGTEDVAAPVYEREEGLDYIPASKALRHTEAQLLTRRARETVLKRLLEPLAPHYDYILIDCAPGDSVLNDNALAAATHVVIPTECSGFSLQGMQNLLLAIDEIRRDINPGLQTLGYLLVKYDKQTKIGKEVSRHLERQEGAKTLKTKIRRCIRFDESPLARQTIFEYAPDSNGAEDYMRLAKEIIAINEGN